MKPQELRIGNYLQDKISKTILEVIELTKEDIITYVIDRSMFPLKPGWGLEPIPLTEEWLLKFGFEYNEGFEGKILDLESGVSFGLGDDGVMYYKGNLEGFWVDVLKEINYLHELQNLIYSLTGEELTIKP